MTFGVDSDGNYGYIKAGADTVTPFKKIPPAIIESHIEVSHITGAGHYVRVLGGTVVVAPNECNTFTLSVMKLRSTAYTISSATNCTYVINDDEGYTITPTDNTSNVTIKYSEIRTDGRLTWCTITSYTY